MKKEVKMYIVNHIKYLDEKIFYNKDKEEKEYYKNMKITYLNNEGITDKKLQKEILKLICFDCDECVTIMESEGWKVL